MLEGWVFLARRERTGCRLVNGVGGGDIELNVELEDFEDGNFETWEVVC